MFVDWLCLAIAWFNSASAAPGAKKKDLSDAFFANHTIPRIQIHLDEDALAALRDNFREYTKATITEVGTTWYEVGIHLKGQYGTFQGIDGRPSLTLNFDKYVDAQRFHGLDKFHLNNSAQDPSYLCEMIGRHAFGAAGIPTARSSHAIVELNGRDLGLYVLVEGFDRKFLKRHFENPDGNLYDSGFRHDITDPIEKSSGQGPDNHADLLALAAAAAEPNHAARLGRLTGLLDLDQFLTFLALESLIRHHDGYSMGINNYRVCISPDTRRAVFMPHGMDQLFFEPRAGLLPDLRGLVAQSVLETQIGRVHFRARCEALFRNLFPGLTNRVELARSKFRSLLAELDPRSARHADEAATNLLRRIQERHSQLQHSLSFRPEVPTFNQSGVASLKNWLATSEARGILLSETNSADELLLQARVSANGGGVGRWEKPVLLTAGTYRFSANVLADQPVFRGPTPPVAIARCFTAWQSPEFTTLRL